MDFLEAVALIYDGGHGWRMKRDNWDNAFLYIDYADYSTLRIVNGDYFYLDEDSQRWRPDADDILADDWEVF